MTQREQHRRPQATMCPSNMQQLSESVAERFSESGSLQWPTHAPQPERPVPTAFTPLSGPMAWRGTGLTEAEHWGMVRARATPNSLPPPRALPSRTGSTILRPPSSLCGRAIAWARGRLHARARPHTPVYASCVYRRDVVYNLATVSARYASLRPRALRGEELHRATCGLG